MNGDKRERAAASAATFTALVVVAAFIAGKSARDAILLAQFGIHRLPLFITIAALSSLPIVLVAGKLMTRFGPARLMPVLNVMSAAFAVVEWLVLGRFPRATAVAVYFHLGTSGALLVSGFWSIVNERFDIQSAKRHIGRIGMGATLGGILGGLIAQGTAVYLSPDSILLVLAGMQLVAAATLYWLRAPVVGQAAIAPTPAPSTGAWSALGVVTRSSLLRTMGAVIVLGAIGAGVLDYVFKADLVDGASKAGLLRSLAIYYTVTSVVTAVVQVAFCGPLVARLGVSRSVATLPVVVTGFGLVALAFPAGLTAVIARGAETITRSSIYRAGYELLYAPLPEADKRPTKLVLDVGAERIGDLLGAQLVALLVFMVAAPRLALLLATAVTGVVTLAFAIRIPRAYTRALEDSLVAQSSEHESPAGAPILGQEGGDLAPLPPRIFARAPRRTAVQPDGITELRSKDSVRIRRALATELAPEMTALAIPLLGRDDVAREALTALRSVAPRCTGALIDALLDPARDVVVRRRIPEILFAGDPALAAVGLWRGLADPTFDVRYRCGVVLARLAAADRLASFPSDAVFEAVRRELVIDPLVWRQRRIADDELVAGDASEAYAGTALEHVFTVLGLALPPEPLRIALHAVETEDAALRETALEYLQNTLPADVWPLLTGSLTNGSPVVLGSTLQCSDAMESKDA